eukprot:2272815-Rhodomonas_salina.1
MSLAVRPTEVSSKLGIHFIVGQASVRCGGGKADVRRSTRRCGSRARALSLAVSYARDLTGDHSSAAPCGVACVITMQEVPESDTEQVMTQRAAQRRVHAGRCVAGATQMQFVCAGLEGGTWWCPCMLRLLPCLSYDYG